MAFHDRQLLQYELRHRDNAAGFLFYSGTLVFNFLPEDGHTLLLRSMPMLAGCSATMSLEQGRRG